MWCAQKLGTVDIVLIGNIKMMSSSSGDQLSLLFVLPSEARWLDS